MSVWGKFSGAAAGLSVGGPVGALVGAVAGHLLLDRDSDPGVTFTIAIIALSGKMAKADGVVTDASSRSSSACSACRRARKPMCAACSIWRARTWRASSIMRQIARLFVGNPAVLEDVLDGLFEIAKADGVLHPGEARFLERVAEIFGFAPNEFRRIRASHFAPELTDPYVILGVSYAAERRRAQTDLSPAGAGEPSRQPDGARCAARILKLATDKLAAINWLTKKSSRNGALS